jgi:Outer membrane efflux protein
MEVFVPNCCPQRQMGGTAVRVSLRAVVILCLVTAAAVTTVGQSKSRKAANKQAETIVSLAKLRDEYIKATKYYKESLGKLVEIYEKNVSRSEDALKQSKLLFDEGLISKQQLDDSEHAVADAKGKVALARQQLETADTQIANTLLEAEAEAKMAKLAKGRRGAFLTTTAYIRYNGSSAWSLGDAWKVQRFFLDTFKRPLPIAVFGQGAIHDRWRLDHHNSMDISLQPDGIEGQTLINFLRASGIPFLAFRQAIPGTATGPHIHVGLPSHRY